MWCFTVEVEWCSAGDVGDSADTDVLAAVCEWLWRWWRSPSIQVWQVQECWAPSVHHTGISMLELASDPDRLAAVANQSVAPASAEAAHWAWVYVKTIDLPPVSLDWRIDRVMDCPSAVFCSLYSFLSVFSNIDCVHAVMYNHDTVGLPLWRCPTWFLRTFHHQVSEIWTSLWLRHQIKKTIERLSVRVLNILLSN